MRIAIILPDGISIRNYVYTGLLSKLREHDLVVLSEYPDAVINEINSLHGEGLKWQLISQVKESRWSNILRRICNNALLFTNARIAGNSAISDDYLNIYTAKSKRKFYLLLFRFTGFLISIIPNGLHTLEKYLKRTMHQSQGGKEANRILAELNPQILFCTHQRSVEAGMLFNEAKHLGIKTITTIFSWDNLTKSRINYVADKYLLWSKHMQMEMQKFYPNIALSSLKITGTPQFDYYRNPQLIWKREKFDTYFSVPDNRPVLCFSGNEPTFPSDHLYLNDLLQAIQAIPLTYRPFIIVRPSPNDHTNRMQKIADRFQSDAVVRKPEWTRIGDEDWVSNYPTSFDMEVLVNICYHSISMVNIGSTMAIDIAHFDKPAIYVNYIHDDLPDYDLPRIYKQEHLKPLVTIKAVEWVTSKKEWQIIIDKIMNHPNEAALERLKFKSLITDNITNAIDAISWEIMRT